MKFWTCGCTGAALDVVSVATLPPPWIDGVLRSVSWTISIRARPSVTIFSPRWASPARSGPGPLTRILVREPDVGRPIVWFVTVAIAVAAGAATAGAGWT